MDWSEWEARFAAFLARQSGEGDVAHDRMHVRRVVENARRIAVAEGADLAVVLPAAWLHDCVIVPKDSPERKMASRLAATAAADFLHSAGYPEEHIPAIQHAIEAHSFSAGIAPHTREARVVQDADRLDALGAVGIARTMMLGGAMGQPLYHPTEPFPVARTPDDSTNVLDHFYVKLLTLSDTMQTAAGRNEAQRRTAFMRQYLTQLGEEIPMGGGGLQPNTVQLRQHPTDARCVGAVREPPSGTAITTADEESQGDRAVREPPLR